MIKRYALFAGRHLYPRKGWHDFIGHFDDIGQAEEVVDLLETSGDFASEWAMVVDLKSGNICQHGLLLGIEGREIWNWTEEQPADFTGHYQWTEF